MTQIRLAEAFQIYNLDLQCRLHYAPGDSRVHIAERVMRSLNKHAREGHTIPIRSIPLTNLVSAGEILAMNQDEIDKLAEQKEEKEAYQCAKSVASLYQGKPCMGTSIHARVPNSCCWDFLIMSIWLNVVWQSSSQKALDACAGSAYFKYQQEFFSGHYLVYDGCVEGIRNACQKKGKKCHFHELIENTKQLAADRWRDLPVERLDTPVPDYDEKSPNFHYCSPQQIESGNFKEKFSLKKG